MFLIFALTVALAPAFAAQKSIPGEPKYDPTTEAVFKGTVEAVTDRQCPVSGGMGECGFKLVGIREPLSILLMTTPAKVFLTLILAGMLLIPGLGEILALPVLAALGYVWGFAPTKK